MNVPAFPGQWDHGDGQVESWAGMTLRDWFAGKAMEATLTRLPYADSAPLLARIAYRVADAMLAERVKK